MTDQTTTVPLELKAACEAVCRIRIKDGDGCECATWGIYNGHHCGCEEIAMAAIGAYEQTRRKAIIMDCNEP